MRCSCSCVCSAGAGQPATACHCRLLAACGRGHAWLVAHLAQHLVLQCLKFLESHILGGGEGCKQQEAAGVRQDESAQAAVVALIIAG